MCRTCIHTQLSISLYIRFILIYIIERKRDVHNTYIHTHLHIFVYIYMHIYIYIYIFYICAVDVCAEFICANYTYANYISAKFTRGKYTHIYTERERDVYCVHDINNSDSQRWLIPVASSISGLCLVCWCLV